jgi:adenine phosphoribosyltransferase
MPTHAAGLRPPEEIPMAKEMFVSQESGEKFRLQIPGLGYALELPYVLLDGDERRAKIASLNLIGQIRLNHDLGRLLAERVRTAFSDLGGVAILTAVEKALQLTQVVAQELGIEAVAVAYNRVKPHMEAARRPIIRVDMGSITSGDKCLVLYERDINLLLSARRGVILVDDVVSSGGTVLGMVDLLAEMARLKRLAAPPPILGIFCVAREGRELPPLPAALTCLTALPPPEIQPARARGT